MEQMTIFDDLKSDSKIMEENKNTAANQLNGTFLTYRGSLSKDDIVSKIKQLLPAGMRMGVRVFNGNVFIKIYSESWMDEYNLRHGYRKPRPNSEFLELEGFQNDRLFMEPEYWSVRYTPTSLKRDDLLLVGSYSEEGIERLRKDITDFRVFDLRCNQGYITYLFAKHGIDAFQMLLDYGKNCFVIYDTWNDDLVGASLGKPLYYGITDDSTGEVYGNNPEVLKHFCGTFTKLSDNSIRVNGEITTISKNKEYI